MNKLEYFNELCNMFKNELETLEKEIKEEDNNYISLRQLGNKYSYELAIIGLQLGYFAWYFEDYGNFKDTKKGVYETIISNEEIDKFYTENEINNISKSIIESKEN